MPLGTALHLLGHPLRRHARGDEHARRIGHDGQQRQLRAQLRSIEATSKGAVEVASAGLSGEGRQLLYATVGDGPDVFWLQSRIHGNELHSTEAALQILRYLGSSGSPEAQRIRDALTVVVIPMYNPDGATANSPSGFTTQGAIFYEVRSVGQKSNGMLEQLFVRPTMAVLNAAADGSLYEHPGTGWDEIPFGDGEPSGGGPG